MFYLKLLKILKPLLGRGFYLSQLEYLAIKSVFLGEAYDIFYIEKVWQTFLNVKYNGFVTFYINREDITYNENTENYKTPIKINIGASEITDYQLTSNKNVVVNLCRLNKLCRGIDLLTSIDNEYKK